MTQRSHENAAATLAALLAERKMTQAQLCRAAGVTPGTVSRYLSGTRGTNIDTRGARTMEKIAAALEVEPDYFAEYRAWKLRKLSIASPTLFDEFYDAIMERARQRGLVDPESGQVIRK